MKKYNAEISFTIDKDHPDKECVKDWKEDKVITFSDIYTFSNEDYEEEDCIAYIKRDLKLVTGGGYNTEHIHNVKFIINRI